MRAAHLFFIGLCLGVIASSVSAQTYRCVNNGRAFYSDRACDTRLGGYGPTPSRNPSSYERPGPEMRRAEDHVQHLSSGCSAISEAIRTGPARGVRSDVMRDLHAEYKQKCAVDDQDARSRVEQERRRAQDDARASREQEAHKQRLLAEKRDRCRSMGDVIAVKRRREAELNPKEVEALRDFERMYKTECSGV